MKTILTFLFCCLCSFLATAQNSRVFFDAGTNLYQADYNSFYQTDNNDLGTAFGFGYQYHLKLGDKLALVGGIETHYGRITQLTKTRITERVRPPIILVRTEKFFVTSEQIQTALNFGVAYEMGKWEIQLSALPTYVVHSKIPFAIVVKGHQSANEVRREREFIPRGELFGKTEDLEGNQLSYSSRFTLNGEASISRTIGKRFRLGLTYNQALTYQQLQEDPLGFCFERFDDCNTTDPRKFLDPRLRRFAARFAYSF